MKKKEGKYNILAVIPARGGSKGVPRKNIRPLAGKPLLYYTIKEALGSKLVTRIIVSSEDDEILNVARKVGGEDVVLRRPKKLAQDKVASLPVVQHAVKEIEAKDKIKFDYIVLLQATSPFVLSKDIDASLEKLIKTGADTVVSVCVVKEHYPIKIKKVIDDKLVPYSSELRENIFRRQDLPLAFRRNGAIYANTRETVMERNSLLGIEGECRPYIMPEERSVDINTMLDFQFADMLMKNKKNKRN